MRGRSGHYIRPNETTRIPRRHVIVDTEAIIDVTDTDVERQRWRLAVAEFCRWTPDRGWTTDRRRYKQPEQLWGDIAAFCTRKERTVVWAHNLAYDLRISQALTHLPVLGFDLDDIRLASPGTWAYWRHESRTLVAVDAAAVWHCPLEVLGRAFDIHKPGLPDSDDTAAWWIRCETDVEILGTAVRTYLDWLRDADMGNWQFTGAGQAFAVWRHRHMTHKILVADDMAARDAERRAMWTGRAEAYRHGTDRTARVYEWDFTAAYATICAEVDLPVRQVSVSRGVNLDALSKWATKYAVLAEVHVSTTTPLVPAMRGDHIVWPTGRFDTVLWDPELRLLAEAGAHVQVGRVWLYRKQPALADWATWILDQLAAPATEVPPWQRIVYKHWSRALIGRFAMRYRTWEPLGEADTFDLRLFTGQDGDTGEPFSILQVGTKLLQATEPRDGNNTVPAITGYVMSEARARLWWAITAIGTEHVLYCDTDSVLLTGPGHHKARRLAKAGALGNLRHKRTFTGWAIAGPRQLIVENQPWISGIPKAAYRTGPWQFEGRIWQSLETAIREGHPGEVQVRKRKFRVHGVDNRRRRLDDGTTTPYVLPEETDHGPTEQ